MMRNLKISRHSNGTWNSYEMNTAVTKLCSRNMKIGGQLVRIHVKK